MRDKFREILITVLLTICSSTYAQLFDFEQFGDVPVYPDTGAWFDPDNSGTGMFMLVQNGILAGAYFGFDDNGQNVWLLFSGRLEQSENLEELWTLETELTRASNGQCIIDCTTDSDGDDQEQEVAGTLSMRFLGRGVAQFSIDGGETTTIMPQLFGTSGFVEFPQVSDITLPILTGNWVVTTTRLPFINDPDAQQPTINNGGISAYVLEIGDREVRMVDGSKAVAYPVLEQRNGGVLEDDFIQSEIVCSVSGQIPACRWSGHGDGSFVNISGTRFSFSRFGVGSPPSVVFVDEARRLYYD